MNSVGLTLTPWRRAYFSSTFSYRDTRTVTLGDYLPVVVPYRGDVFSFVTSANYILNQATDLHASYSFSRADYAQHDAHNTLPLGIRYDWHGMQVGVRRHFKKNMTANFQYGYFVYDEPKRLRHTTVIFELGPNVLHSTYHATPHPITEVPDD